MKFAKSLPDTITHLSMFSDCCAGQNRNSIVASMLHQIILKTKIEVIDLKFLEPGHTHMECDSMHATIETASEYAKIFIPTDWVNVIRLAKKGGQPYDVNILSYKDFFDYKTFKDSNYFFPSKSENGMDLNWKEVRWLRFQKANPDTLFFKNEFWEEEFESVNIKKRKGRKGNSDFQLRPIYNSTLPIDEKKYSDLQFLCHGKDHTVPSIYHNFYDSLPHVTSNLSDDELPLSALRAKILKRKRKRN